MVSWSLDSVLLDNNGSTLCLCWGEMLHKYLLVSAKPEISEQRALLPGFEEILRANMSLTLEISLKECKISSTLIHFVYFLRIMNPESIVYFSG